MMVGPSGSGKSTAWRVLLKALEKLEGIECVARVIDPKVHCVLTFTAQFFIPSLVFVVAMLTCTVCRSRPVTDAYTVNTYLCTLNCIL